MDQIGSVARRRPPSNSPSAYRKRTSESEDINGSFKPTGLRAGYEGVRETFTAMMASSGLRPNNLVDSPLNETNTNGSDFIHSINFLEEPLAAISISLTYCAPNSLLARVRLKRSTIPCSRWFPTAATRTCTPCLLSTWVVARGKDLPKAGWATSADHACIRT